MNKTRIQVPTSLVEFKQQHNAQYRGIGIVQLPPIQDQKHSLVTWRVLCEVVCDELNDSVNEDTISSVFADKTAKVTVNIYTERTTSTGLLVRSEPSLIKAGVNIGKSNEQSIIQTAVTKMLQMNRDMLKKKGSTVDNSANQVSKTETITHQQAPKLQPMLLSLYKHSNNSDHNIKNKTKQLAFPCYIQRKYDGLRCVAVASRSGGVCLWSRGQCEYTNLQHINAQIREFINKTDIEDWVFFDGELYKHGSSLQQLNSIIKNETSDTKDIQLRVFDFGFVSKPNSGFATRLALLKHVLPSDWIVETGLIECSDKADELMDTYIQEGYEGAVLRGVDSEYVFSVNAKRSNTTLKYKRRLDIEVQVVGYTSGKGKDANAVVFLCEFQGLQFNVVQNTTLQHRRQQLVYLKTNPDAFTRIKQIPLTIEYSDMSSQGIPQQPRATVFRYDLVDPRLHNSEDKALF